MSCRDMIDSIAEIPNRDHLTHADLCVHHSTGQAILLSGSGRNKKYGYRNGTQTNLGDIRNDVWRELVHALIIRSHDEKLFANLLEWEKQHNHCYRTKAELEQHTLELYASRLFACPQWVDYAVFVKHYGYEFAPFDSNPI